MLHTSRIGSLLSMKWRILGCVIILCTVSLTILTLNFQSSAAHRKLPSFFDCFCSGGVSPRSNPADEYEDQSPPDASEVEMPQVPLRTSQDVDLQACSGQADIEYAPACFTYTMAEPAQRDTCKPMNGRAAALRNEYDEKEASYIQNLNRSQESDVVTIADTAVALGITNTAAGFAERIRTYNEYLRVVDAYTLDRNYHAWRDCDVIIQYVYAGGIFKDAVWMKIPRRYNSDGQAARMKDIFHAYAILEFEKRYHGETIAGALSRPHPIFGRECLTDRNKSCPSSRDQKDHCQCEAPWKYNGIEVKFRVPPENYDVTPSETGQSDASSSIEIDEDDI